MLRCNIVVTIDPTMPWLEFEKYFKKTLSLSAPLRGWPNVQRLPIYLRQRYDFAKTTILSRDCLVIEDTDSTGQTPATIKKDIENLKKYWDGEVIYLNSGLSSYNRDRLINLKVPFVVPGRQMYLPTFAIDLREHFSSQSKVRAIFSPATHALILRVIYSRKLDGITPSETALDLGFSAMTMTRCFNELEQVNIGNQVVGRRQRLWVAGGDGKLLWEQALPYLRSPVKVPMYLSDVKNKNGVLAGLSALTHYSSLSEPRNLALAIDRSQISTIFTNKSQIRPSLEPDLTEIQVWFYSPTLFSKKSVADRLSVFLSLKDDPDERVQSALAEMMEGMKW